MSSPFDDLTDSLQERKQRDHRHGKKRRLAFYRVVALMFGAMIGAGVGSTVESGEIGQVGVRVGGAILFGLFLAGFLFTVLVRLTVLADVVGREAGLDDSWLLTCVTVCGAVVGATFGSIVFLPSGPPVVGLSGGLGGAVLAVILVWGVWRQLARRKRE